MENTTTRMRGIIERLLDVVRTQLVGGIAVSSTAADLAEIVTGAARRVGP